METAEKALEQLHKQGRYNPKDISEIKEYQDLIRATCKALLSGMGHQVPQAVKDYLQQDALLFSGLKTHAQLTEARSLLVDENGIVRNFYDFRQDMIKLNQAYNVRYLEAEHHFATHSAQSASHWEDFQDDTQRYYLQYRTASDDRVREEHAILHDITLPKDDPFWKEFYPPNGWNCRCHVVEVLADGAEKSNSRKAIEKAKIATTQIGKDGTNTLDLFRFNSGMDKKLMPANNPYTKVPGAKTAVKETQKLIQKP